MQITIKRIKQGNNSTLSEIYIDDQFFCYGLEDCLSSIDEVSGSALTLGSYELKLYSYGAMHARYHRKFPGLHRGILHVTGNAHVKYAYILTGKDFSAAKGGLLVGQGYTEDDSGDYQLLKSSYIYKLLYNRIINAIKIGQEVILEVTLSESLISDEGTSYELPLSHCK